MPTKRSARRAKLIEAGGSICIFALDPVALFAGIEDCGDRLPMQRGATGLQTAAYSLSVETIALQLRGKSVSMLVATLCPDGEDDAGDVRS